MIRSVVIAFIRVTMVHVSVLWVGSWVFLGAMTVPVMAQDRVLPKPQEISEQTIVKPHLYCHSEKCQYRKVDESTQIPGWTWYTLDDYYKMGVAITDKYLRINCDFSETLNSGALPSAKSALQISYLSLSSCAMPNSISLAELFAKMNVSLKCVPDSPDEPQSTLNILNMVAPPRLTAKHFNGFECLSNLKIEGSALIQGSYNKDKTTENNFLAPLQNLKSIAFTTFPIQISELDVLKSLENLKMESIDDIERLPLTPGLKTLELTDWIIQQPLQHDKDRCDSLRQLHLIDLTAEELPDGWLMNCSSLEIFEIKKANITTLPPKLLVGTASLTQLTIIYTALETLPLDLLNYSPKLQKLVLKQNKLHTISSGTFLKAGQLKILDLSSNDLEQDVMEAFPPLRNLTELHLGYKTRLGDLCGPDGSSLIRYLTELDRIDLESTGVTRICHDWTQLPHLKTLILMSTKISKITLEDLHFKQTNNLYINLIQTPLTTIQMTREQYKNAKSLLSGIKEIAFGTRMARLECDCQMYWTRRAFDLSVPAFRFLGIQKCSNGMYLKDVAPESMLCPGQEECVLAGLPDACECKVRPDDHLEKDRLMVSAKCANASLSRIPRLKPLLNQSTERDYELYLSHNHITELHADDVQKNIKALDLRYNSLKSLDEETASKLCGVDGMLLLAGNPLDCSCYAAPLLRGLALRNPLLTDRHEATCENGNKLLNMSVEDCVTISVTGWISIALGIAAAVLIGIIVCFGTRERRLFAKAILHHWGLEWRAEEEDDREYDMFLTFAHPDENFAREILTKLEPEYRVCVHLRDWVPGRLISEQVMKSVQQSRRTVSLVSRHFLTSRWTQAEFREAHTAAMMEARPRLIVVFLEEPSELDMTDELKRYVATRTYLRRADPWFWDKLAVALPRPRPERPHTSSPYEELPMIDQPPNDDKSR